MSVSTSAIADPTLIGKWRSDQELTMRFIKDNVKLQDKISDFIGDMMGRLTLTFTHDKVHSSLQDYDVIVEGKKHRMVGFNEHAPYTILYSSNRIIVTSGREPVTGNVVVTKYNFDSPDVMWIYTGGADSVLPNSHYREYFRRVP
ncbi:MAG: hypothetical protein JNK95_09775 [Candidatus Competibacter sp.]|nr:hypothetical protein [Candidatus Competibacter sp.]